MKTLFRILIIFLAITGAYSLLNNNTPVQFGQVDFFVKHGWFFLGAIAFFPRLTLFVSGLFFGSIEFGGVIWWLGFFFAPRILVATLATLAYWNTNPILVIIAWLVALGGESSEKVIITRRMRGRPREENDAIEAEYEVKN